MAQDFAQKFSVTFNLYTDPQKESYMLMGWKRKFGLSIRSFTEGFKAMGNGFRQGSLAGDPWQQGGEAIITQKGEVWWSQPVDQAGTHSSRAELLSLIDRFAEEKGLPRDHSEDLPQPSPQA